MQDSREQTDPRIVGTGTNDDDQPFPIRATTDVGQFVGEAVAQLARRGANCAEVLSDAVKDAFTETIADPSLQQAWMSGQPTPSAARTPASQPPAASGTVEERLKTLDDLLKRGVITKDEHATRRAAILKEL